MSNKLEVSLNAVLNVPTIKVNGENISNTLDGKADINHTHDIDDVILTYEEEEEIVNAEEETITTTVTKTKTLSSILNTKSDVGHTHSYNDLTNKLDLGNYKARIPKKNAEGRYRYIAIGQGDYFINCTGDTYGTMFGVKRDGDIECGDASIRGTLTVAGDIIANDVNINTTLANKANAIHTHKTNDISRDYTTTIIYNGEEEETTETISLNTILDGKADLNHTHDYSSTYAGINHNHVISDITNLQTTLDGKLDNTIVSTHTFVSGNSLATICTSMPESGIKLIEDYPSRLWTSVIFKTRDYRTFMLSASKIGNGHDFRIYYSHTNDNNNNPYSTIKYDDIPTNNNWKSKTDINTLLSGKADLNHTHDYSSTYAPLTHTHDIDDVILTYEEEEETLNGEEETVTTTVTKTKTLSDVLDGKADSSHTHTSSQLTDLNALKIEIFKMIYPIGSIYITLTPLDASAGFSGYGTNLPYTWNGCKWEYLDDGLFLRNGGHDMLDFAEGASTRIPTGAGNTGGSETHTHTTGNHTLTKEEMPRHNHTTTADGGQYLWGGTYGNRIAGGNGFSNSGANIVTGWAGGLNGSTQPHNHGNTGSASSLPPYITCYMYKRIA